MKEYYPAQYARLQSYIDSDRWHVSGCAVDANDVMVSSAEAIMRNWLYGSVYYKNEFGVRGGRDIMLPDCFGFPYTLPSLAAHCGMTGFIPPNSRGARPSTAVCRPSASGRV